jgi:hypothetical protein
VGADNVFGPFLTLSDVEDAVLAHVRAWIPDYLREVERHLVTRPSGQTLVPGTLPLPKSYERASQVDKWPESQLPAVVFSSPGLADGGLRRDGAGTYEGTWVVALHSVVAGNDDRSTRWLAGAYTAALRLLMTQQAMVEGLDVEAVEYADEAYDQIPHVRARSLMAGTATFELTVRDLASASAGPSAPSGEPATDPGPWPEVEETELIVEKVDDEEDL